MVNSLKKSERFANSIKKSVAGNKCDEHGVADNCINGKVLVENVDTDGDRKSITEAFVDQKAITLV